MWQSKKMKRRILGIAVTHDITAMLICVGICIYAQGKNCNVFGIIPRMT